METQKGRVMTSQIFTAPFNHWAKCRTSLITAAVTAGKVLPELQLIKREIRLHVIIET